MSFCLSTLKMSILEKKTKIPNKKIIVRSAEMPKHRKREKGEDNEVKSADGGGNST